MSKILQICVEGNRGSTGTIAEAIGLVAISNGWDSYIAHGRFPRPSKSKLFKIGTSIDLIMHVIETRLFDRHGLGSRKATRKLIRDIESIKPDIIHLHHLHGYYINIEILFEYFKNAMIPVIWTFHDCWSFTGHCCFFDFVGCEKWKTECFKCPQKNEYPASFLLDRSSKNYALKKKLFTSLSQLTIVSVSKWLDNLVAQSFLRNQKHLCIYNGVDIEVFKISNNSNETKQKYGLNQKFVLLGVATTWDRRKGLEDFITLSGMLNHDEAIVLVGLSKSQRQNLPSNIIGLSKTESRKELVDLYSASDIFLNLSDEETFGLTTAESMACETPVIVYNRTASPEIISEDCGFVVNKGDFEGLLFAIQRIKENGKAKYSEACRKRVLEYFVETKCYNEYINLYKRVLNI